ncbi:MAG: ATP-binding protein [Methanomethylovorans sp.]|uniref:ATP-binding protein n=1 Tax=Methanomethylovorans sp. TaxID=2758717 RepID=UPI003530D0F2
MINLERLEVHGFKQFASKEEFSFSDKINVITGPNEAGKSTILDAILVSLFDCKPSEKEYFCSWNNGDICTVELDFNLDDGLYKIKRDIKNNKSSLWKKVGTKFTEISSSKSKITDFVDKHFGFKELRVFSSTLVIGQNDITILQQKNSAEKTTFNRLKEMIEQSTAGSKEVDSSLSKVIANVNNMHKDLISTSRRGAKIPQIEQEIGKLNSQFIEARTKKQNHTKNTKAKDDLESELNLKSSRLEELENRKKLYDAKNRIEKRIEQIESANKKAQSSLDQISSLEKEVFDTESESKPLEQKYSTLSDEKQHKIHSLTTSCNEAKKRLEDKQKVANDVKKELDNKNGIQNQYDGFDNYSEEEIQNINSKINRWKIISPQIEKQPEIASPPSSQKGYIVSFILVVAGLIAGMILGNIIAGTAVGIVLGILAYRTFNAKSTEKPDEHLIAEKNEYEKEFSKIKSNIPSFDPLTFQDRSKEYIKLLRDIEVLRSRIEQLEGDVSAEKASFDSNSSELDSIIRSIPNYSYDSFEHEVSQLKRYRVTIEEKKKALNNLLASNSKEELRELLRTNASELIKLDVEWQEQKLDYVSFSEEEVNSIVNIDNLRREVDKIDREYAESKGRVKESLNSDINDLELEEEIEYLQNKKEKMKYKAQLLEILLKYLDETDKEIKARFAPQVAEKMTPWLSRVTNDKYSTISLSSDMDLAVQVPEMESFVNIDTLSRGTQDQIYLGLRIIIGDLISGERSVPVFLDDTMHTFDAIRLASVKTFFEEISQTRQVFLFSHNDAYKDWGEQGTIIEL